MVLWDPHGSFYIGPKCLTPERRLWERMGTFPSMAPCAAMRSIDIRRTVHVRRFCLRGHPARFQAFSASHITNPTQRDIWTQINLRNCGGYESISSRYHGQQRRSWCTKTPYTALPAKLCQAKEKENTGNDGSGGTLRELHAFSPSLALNWPASVCFRETQWKRSACSPKSGLEQHGKQVTPRPARTRGAS